MPQSAAKKSIRLHTSPSIVGWNGIYLEVPSEWNLSAASGDMAQGHIRIDGPGEMHVRVRWNRVKKKPGPEGVQRILNRYLKGLEKGSRRRKLKFESNQDVRLTIQSEGAKRKPLFFSWQGRDIQSGSTGQSKAKAAESQAVGLIWYCAACGRITIAQVDGPIRRSLTQVASQILGTLDDHAVEGCHTWAVYGLAAEIPADFVLSGHKLLSGYIQLRFTKGQSSIQLDRWAMADVALKNVPLQRWVNSHFAKVLRGFNWSKEDADIRGHKGLALTGTIRGIRDRIRAVAMSAVRLRPANRLTQYSWQCEETNRICSVQVIHSKEEAGLAEEIAASYVCHT